MHENFYCELNGEYWIISGVSDNLLKWRQMGKNDRLSNVKPIIRDEWLRGNNNDDDDDDGRSTERKGKETCSIPTKENVLMLGWSTWAILHINGHFASWPVLHSFHLVILAVITAVIWLFID